MVCNKCGANNPNEAKFCYQCGSSLLPENVQQEPAELPDKLHNDESSLITQQESADQQSTPCESTPPDKSDCESLSNDFATSCVCFDASNILLLETKDLADETHHETLDKPEDTRKDSSRESNYQATQNDFNEPINQSPSEKNDTICPFCHNTGCQPMQKNSIETKNTGYKWGAGCCGMFLLGPFGLLCGLCGTGSKTKTESELWWTCLKCGKQHIALADALKKWERTISILPLIGLYFGIGMILAKAIINWIMIWLFGYGFLSSAATFVFGIIGVIAGLTMGVQGIHDELSQELGESIDQFLSKEQKDDEVTKLIISIGIALAISLLGLPVLNLILGE